MTQTQDNLTAYDTQTEVATTTGVDVAFPKLFWAGALLFAVNVVVIGFIAVSPNLAVNMYGSEREVTSSPAARPSPFTEVVSDKPVRVKLAAKMQPLLSEQAATLEMPRSTQGAQAEATQLDLPRLTASSMPRRTEVSRVGTLDVAPRRVSEREQKPIVVN